jgi:hypothetical protein
VPGETRRIRHGAVVIDKERATIQYPVVLYGKSGWAFRAAGMERCQRRMTLLEHLILRPKAGLGNRLQAICSARRLSLKYGFKLTLCWDWGDFHRLFQPVPGMDWIPSIPPEGETSYRNIALQLLPPEIAHRGQRVPMTGYRWIVLHAAHMFCATEEEADDPNIMPEFHRLLPWPTELIARRIAEFKQENFGRIIGMHIRRGDLRLANKESPDALFIAEAERLVDDNYDIFLATDNAETEQMMRQRFGGRIVSYPKNATIKKRWPRKAFSYEETRDDLIDLQLLAGCERIIGSYGSSYTRIAACYLGQLDKCKILQMSESSESVL